MKFLLAIVLILATGCKTDLVSCESVTPSHGTAYYYATAYYLVTRDAELPAQEPELPAQAPGASNSNSAAASDGVPSQPIKEIAPPAASVTHPSIVITGYEGCEACEYIKAAYTKAGIPFKYVNVAKPVKGVEYPNAMFDFAPVNYEHLKTYLENQK